MKKNPTLKIPQAPKFFQQLQKNTGAPQRGGISHSYRPHRFHQRSQFPESNRERKTALTYHPVNPNIDLSIHHCWKKKKKKSTTKRRKKITMCTDRMYPNKHTQSTKCLPARCSAAVAAASSGRPYG